MQRKRWEDTKNWFHEKFLAPHFIIYLLTCNCLLFKKFSVPKSQSRTFKWSHSIKMECKRDTACNSLTHFTLLTNQLTPFCLQFVVETCEEWNCKKFKINFFCWRLSWTSPKAPHNTILLKIIYDSAISSGSLAVC